MLGPHVKRLLGLALLLSLAMVLVLMPSREPRARATVSGHNGRIAFTRYGVLPNSGDIYTIDPNGTGIERLTYHNVAFYPAWSPNGRSIAYTGPGLGNVGGGALWIMNSDGSGTRPITHPGRAVDQRAAWGPKGGRIAFDRVLGPPDLWIVNADGTGARRLRRDGMDPTWSPDGTRIAFTAANSRAPNGGIWVITLAGGKPRLLTSPRMAASEPSWSPDGGWIAFTGREGIRALNLRTHKIRRLTVGSDRMPAWSPDGTRIAFARSTRRKNGTLTPSKIWTIGLNARGARQVTWLAHRSDWMPDWQSLR